MKREFFGFCSYSSQLVSSSMFRHKVRVQWKLNEFPPCALFCKIHSTLHRQPFVFQFIIAIECVRQEDVRTQQLAQIKRSVKLCMKLISIHCDTWIAESCEWAFYFRFHEYSFYNQIWTWCFPFGRGSVDKSFSLHFVVNIHHCIWISSDIFFATSSNYMFSYKKNHYSIFQPLFKTHSKPIVLALNEKPQFYGATNFLFAIHKSSHLN